jgi:uncharacterized protein
MSNNPNGTVIELLSCGGDFTATKGPAIGLTSTDIGVSESSLTIPGTSLQICPDLGEWTGSIANMKGLANANCLAPIPVPVPVPVPVSVPVKVPVAVPPVKPRPPGGLLGWIMF